MSNQQRLFLLNAINQLNVTQREFATKLAVSQEKLNFWLLPSDAAQYSQMPDDIYTAVGKLLADDNVGNVNNLGKISYNGKAQLISVEQFSRDSLADLLRIADLMQPIAKRQKVCRVLEGAVLANLFFEASTRTRLSFGAAFCRLGGSVLDTTGFTFSSMAKGESIYDTSRVISGYADVMAIRHPEKGSVTQFADAVNIPVVNAGDGAGEHPSQSLLDLYTIEHEFARLGKKVDGAHIVMTGDLKYGRTVHSLSKLLSLYQGIRFTFIAPQGLEMPKYVLDYISKNGHVVEQTSDLLQGLKGADVVYATRIQQERLQGENIDKYRPKFQINKAHIEQSCGKDTLIMHPLPRDSREGAFDLSIDLNLDPRLVIFRQADNGVAVRMAIFAKLLGVDDQISNSLRDTTWQTPLYYGVNDAIFDV